MRLLVDDQLSERIVGRLSETGSDTVHVTGVGLGSTDGDVILLLRPPRTGSFTADTDFSTMLALRRRSSPSVVMLRSSDHLTPDAGRPDPPRTRRGRAELDVGAVASVTTERIRIRRLPITDP